MRSLIHDKLKKNRHMKSISIIAAIVLFFSFRSQAQNGCVVYYGGGTYESVVYSVPTGVFTTCNGYPVEEYSSTGVTAINPTCQIGNPFPDNLRQCRVGPSCGVLLQDYISCPIDDYIPILFVLVSAAVWYRFKINKLVFRFNGVM